MNTLTSLAGFCFNASRRTCRKSQDTNNKRGIVLGMTSISTKKINCSHQQKSTKSPKQLHTVLPFIKPRSLIPSCFWTHRAPKPFNLLLSVSKLTDKQRKKSKEKQRKHCGGYECFLGFFWINSLKFDGESSRRFAYTGHISGIYCACIGRVLKANDGLIEVSYNLYWNCNVNTGRFLNVKVWKVIALDSSLYTRTEMTLIC